MDRLRTLTACDNCQRGYPYAELVKYTNNNKADRRSKGGLFCRKDGGDIR